MRNTVTQFLRRRLELAAGLATPLTPTQIAESQGHHDAYQRITGKMTMGYFRYGPWELQPIGAYDYVSEAKRRLDRYTLTRNMDYLLDAAAIALMEFRRPNTPGAYFKTLDDADHAERLD